MLMVGIFYTLFTGFYTLFGMLIVVFVLFGIAISFVNPRLKRWAESGQPPRKTQTQ